jgi:hypothetical protein
MEVKQVTGRPCSLKDAVAYVETLLPIDDINVKKRFDRGYNIVVGTGGYELVCVDAATWHIYRASTSLLEDNSAVYKVDVVDKTCTCPDYNTARAGLCKHRIAVMIKTAQTAERS